jgi:hypothetical protein
VESSDSSDISGMSSDSSDSEDLGLDSDDDGIDSGVDIGSSALSTNVINESSGPLVRGKNETSQDGKTISGHRLADKTKNPKINKEKVGWLKINNNR